MPRPQRPQASAPSAGKSREADVLVRVPEDVIHRAFGEQLVLLNLRSGQYHGLNHSARRMFELVLEHGGSAGVAAELAAEYARPREEIAADLDALLGALGERGLIEVVAAAES